MNGLAPHTEAIFEAVTRLECIKPYVLVGGTALALQLGTRLSEDLDFMSWRESVTGRREIDWPTIKRELENVGHVDAVDILDMEHVEFIVNGVKISFYASPNRSPLQSEVRYLNNLHLADLTAIGAMKMEVMLRRSKFRDYYDIYALLEAGIDLREMMTVALKYSRHQLKSKNLIAMLTRSDRFVPDANFALLQPRYNVTPKDIENRIISAIKAL